MIFNVWLHKGSVCGCSRIKEYAFNSEKAKLDDGNIKPLLIVRSLQFISGRGRARRMGLDRIRRDSENLRYARRGQLAYHQLSSDPADGLSRKSLRREPRARDDSREWAASRNQCRHPEEPRRNVKYCGTFSSWQGRLATLALFR
jgi:hypothetical protein